MRLIAALNDLSSRGTLSLFMDGGPSERKIFTPKYHFLRERQLKNIKPPKQKYNGKAMAIVENLRSDTNSM